MSGITCHGTSELTHLKTEYTIMESVIMSTSFGSLDVKMVKMYYDAIFTS